MTRPTRRLEPLAVAFLYTLAAALILGASRTTYGHVFEASAYTAAAAFLALPWVTSTHLRSVLAGLVAFVLIGQVLFLFRLGAWTIGLVWGAVLQAVLLVLTRDQDQNFRQKVGLDE